jgi:hypothetical protein
VQKLLVAGLEQMSIEKVDFSFMTPLWFYYFINAII